jgi:hypothetical protein
MLPNLIVIGGMKCGTTSLHYYLNLHPEIFMSRQKELQFFIGEVNWEKGVEWYKSNFSGQAKILGEASPNYTYYPFYSGVPEKMYSVVPDAKLIYMVRDPVERVISQYVHSYADGRERQSLSEALKDFDNNPYLCRSKYFMQLEQYLSYFPPENILVVAQEDLYDRRPETLREVFSFLDVDPSFNSEDFSRLRNTSSEKRRRKRIELMLSSVRETETFQKLPPKLRRQFNKLLYLTFSSRVKQYLPFAEEVKRPLLDESLRRDLVEYFREDAKRLREYTGKDFEGWCV